MALALIAFGWLQSLNGSSYLFGSYSHALKLVLQLDQRHLTALKFFTTLGNASGIGPALLYDRIPPVATVALALAHSSVGYLLIWIALKNPTLFSPWELCLFQLLSGMAQTYIQTAALVSCVRIFPGDRGFVLGYLKALVGLSASILIQFFLLICRGREDCMPLLLSWLLPLLSAAPMLAISRPLPPPTRISSSISCFLTASMICLAIYLLASLILENIVVLGRFQVGIVNLGLCTLLLSPIYLLVKSRNASSQEEDLLPGNSEEHGQEQESMKEHQEFTALEAIATLDFWLLFLALLLGSGASSAVEGNLSQLGHSLGYSSRTITICISLFSISSCAGRMGSGILSEHFTRFYGIPRFVFLILAMGIEIGSLLLGIFAVRGTLFFVAILSGVVDGAIWCLAIAAASDLFGLGSFSAILNIVTAACPIGEFLLSILLVGSFYDSQARGRDGKSLLCFGPQCFAGSFVAVAFACGVAAMAFAALACRNWKMYHRLRL